jgi:hypothetical protein
MAQPYLVKIVAIAAKIETVSGTDSVPTLAANAIRFQGVPILTVETIESGDRPDEQHAGFGELGRAAPAGRFGTLDVTMDLFGKGTAYTAVTDAFQPGVFLRAGGCSVTYAGGLLDFIDLDIPAETMSMYLWGIDGNLYKLLGCIAKPKINLKPGQPGKITFGCEGMMPADPAAATISGLALPTTVPPIWADNALQIGTWSNVTAAPNALSAKKLDIDFGTESVKRAWAGAGTLQGIAVVDRKPTADMDVEAVALTTFNPYAGAMESSASAADKRITTTIPGGVGNTVQIITGQFLYTHPKHINIGGLAGWGLSGKIQARSGSAPIAGRALLVRIS